MKCMLPLASHCVGDYRLGAGGWVGQTAEGGGGACSFLSVFHV